MESNFDKDLRESETLFKQQFNPNSIHFHNGDPTPVPLGGERIPNSMPTVYDPEMKELDEKKIDYGPEHDRLLSIREFFNNLKKSLAKLTPPMEAILRHKETFKKSANQTNPSNVSKLQKSIDLEKDKIVVVLKELKDMAAILKTFPEYHDTYYLNLNKIIENGIIDFQDKEQYTTYSFEVKNYSKDAFKEMGILLDKIKAIKKQVEGKPANHEPIPQKNGNKEEEKKEEP